MPNTIKYRKDYAPSDFKLLNIFLDFSIEENFTTVITKSTFQKNSSSKELVLYGHAFEFKKLQYKQQDFINYTITDQQLIIDVSGIEADIFEFEITTVLSPATNTSLQGLYQSGNILCTQCEAEGFRQITYSLDRPDILAKYTTKITADKTKYPYLLSNGNLIDKGDLANNKHWVLWEDPFFKPSYLFALVAGDFDLLKDNFVTKSGRNINLELYVDKGNLSRAYWSMESLKSAMAWDEQRFNREYDLDIYMIVAVDFFNMGAMENKGLNIFNSAVILADSETATDSDYLRIRSVIGHEYFHNWSGNRVTCRDWFQLSLKEGLTVFREQEFSSDLGSRIEERINNVRLIKTAQFAEDASPMSHPVRPDQVLEMNNFYTMTIYEKGAEVIRMMHTILGEDLFQKGMQLYFDKNDGNAVTCDDFVAAMEEAANIDLTQFKRWYSQSGTPKLVVTDAYNANTLEYSLTVKQINEPTADQMEKLNLHIPLKISLYNKIGAEYPLISDLGNNIVDNLLNIKKAEQTFVFKQIDAKPIPALLRDFSAPVKLEYSYTKQDLLHLLMYASDEYTKWDSAQKLYFSEMHTNLHNNSIQAENHMSSEFIDSLNEILNNSIINPALLSLILNMPTYNEFAENYDEINPDLILDIRYFMVNKIAREFTNKLMEIYQSSKLSDYKITNQDIAQRKLRNTCLSYLAFTDNGNELAKEHYYMANNMTDSLTALSSATYAGLACLEELSKDFETKWLNNTLVMDKWFAIQAIRTDIPAIENMRQLTNHVKFNINNPNRVRALFRNFAINNPRYFHATDGSGYNLMVDIISQLNGINPQSASNLLDPLIKFKRYDLQRQELIKKGLNKLLKLDNLSNNLYEKLNKALNA